MRISNLTRIFEKAKRAGMNTYFELLKFASENKITDENELEKAIEKECDKRETEKWFDILDKLRVAQRELDDVIKQLQKI